MSRKKIWDYAEMSRQAKLAGGPKKLLEKEYMRGVNDARKQYVLGTFLQSIFSGKPNKNRFK